LAAYLELTLEQGANLTSVVTVNDAQGDAVNLTTYSAASQLRNSYYSSSANTLTATITGNANGEITLTMTAANTALLTPGRYVYDLEKKKKKKKKKKKNTPPPPPPPPPPMR